MKWLYLILNIGSISIPLLYSFEKKMRFIKHIKALTISTLTVGLFFILWDIWFTHIGIWGFNPKYNIGVQLFNMPIEEWMFFICIPYACVFTHYAIFYFNPKLKLSKTATTLTTLCISILSLTLAIYNYQHLYTFVNFTTLFLILIYGYLTNKALLQQYFISFLVILIPFIIVNGILTGTFIEEEVVWYNNSENLQLRLLTIPVEDMGYAFSLLFSNLLIFEALKNKTSLWQKRKTLTKI